MSTDYRDDPQRSKTSHALTFDDVMGGSDATLWSSVGKAFGGNISG